MKKASQLVVSAVATVASTAVTKSSEATTLMKMRPQMVVRNAARRSISSSSARSISQTTPTPVSATPVIQNMALPLYEMEEPEEQTTCSHVVYKGDNDGETTQKALRGQRRSLCPTRFIDVESRVG